MNYDLSKGETREQAIRRMSHEIQVAMEDGDSQLAASKHRELMKFVEKMKPHNSIQIRAMAGLKYPWD